MSKRVLSIWVGLFVLLCCGSARAEDPVSPEAEAWIRTLRQPPWKDDKVDEVAVAAARVGVVALDDYFAFNSANRLLMSYLASGRIEGIALVVKRKLQKLYPDVREAVHDRDHSVAQAALRVLHLVKSDPMPVALANGARDDALARLDDPELTEEVLHALMELEVFSDPVVVRRLARMSLAKAFPPTQDEERLEERGYIFHEMINSRSFRVRSLALRTMMDLIAVSPEHAKEVYGCCNQVDGTSADESSDVRYHGVQLYDLLTKHSPDQGEAMFGFLSDRDRMVATYAWNIVARHRLAKTKVFSERLLFELKHADEPEARASAAWLLRDGHVTYAPRIESELTAIINKSKDVPMRRSAIAALLMRGVVPKSKYVVPTVVALVEEKGVTLPYPGGGRKWSSDTHGQYPLFRTLPQVNTTMLKALGARAVSALVAKYEQAKPEQRSRWIHALAHCGTDGMQAMDALSLEGAPLVVRAFIQAHRSPPVLASIEVLLPLLKRDHYSLMDASLESAFKNLGEAALPKVLAAMAKELPTKSGDVSDWFQGAEYVVKAVGAPARAHIERAIATHPNASEYFQALLREIR